MRRRRVLFLCTANSARSQMAEALLTRKARGRFEVASAGSHPAARVDPLAVEALREAGIEWTGREPKGIDAVLAEPWDFVITVCDRARESCPVLPGHPITAHWGMEDPAEVEGTEQARLEAFVRAARVLAQRIDLMLALPVEKLDRLSVARRIASIASAEASPG